MSIHLCSNNEKTTLLVVEGILCHFERLYIEMSMKLVYRQLKSVRIVKFLRI